MTENYAQTHGTRCCMLNTLRSRLFSLSRPPSLFNDYITGHNRLRSKLERNWLEQLTEANWVLGLDNLRTVLPTDFCIVGRQSKWLGQAIHIFQILRSARAVFSNVRFAVTYSLPDTSSAMYETRALASISPTLRSSRGFSIVLPDDYCFSQTCR